MEAAGASIIWAKEFRLFSFVEHIIQFDSQSDFL
jgi:hypothetical protein